MAGKEPRLRDSQPRSRDSQSRSRESLTPTGAMLLLGERAARFTTRAIVIAFVLLVLVLAAGLA